MKKFIIAGVALAALAGVANADTRNLSGFDSVNAADRIQVVVTQGQGYAVRVEGPEANKVRTTVDRGALMIRQTNRPWFGGTPRVDATVHVTLPQVEGLAATRGASVEAEGLNARQLSLAAAMGGEMRVTGRCTTVTARASMGGVVDAEELQCGSADVTASMGGEASVFAANSVDGAASMGGIIEASGGGTTGEVRTSMGGEFSRR